MYNETNYEENVFYENTLHEWVIWALLEMMWGRQELQE